MEHVKSFTYFPNADICCGYVERSIDCKHLTLEQMIQIAYDTAISPNYEIPNVIVQSWDYRGKVLYLRHCEKSELGQNIEEWRS